MSLDLTLCVVPEEIHTLISKAKVNAVYAEWMAFVPSMLLKGKIDDQGDTIIKEINHDTAGLGKYHKFSGTEDYLYDAERVSASLDHILDHIIDINEAVIAKQILWKGGNAVCDQCNGTQGLPVKLYGLREIERICTFLKTVSEEQLLSFYDYEKMQDDSVYKPVSPENKHLLIPLFINVKKLFERAYEQQMFVLKVID